MAKRFSITKAEVDRLVAENTKLKGEILDLEKYKQEIKNRTSEAMKHMQAELGQLRQDVLFLTRLLRGR